MSDTQDVSAAILGRRLRVRGQVQGVGFRPHVWRLAKSHALTGQVLNDSDGVTIEVWGSDSHLSHFQEALCVHAPPLARIDSIELETLAGTPRLEFTIATSTLGTPQTAIAPDAATCEECRRESLDPFARRYRYPFTNCTHCGPRFSIACAIPFDRANTTLADFELCADCMDEYSSPEDRRHHAQAIACHRCGPAVRLERSDGREFFLDALSPLDAVDAASSLLQRGALLAIKGTGGFHLACDAHDSAAVARLRDGKRRQRKPFAVMMRDLEVVRRYCELDGPAERALTDRAAPIVLLPIKSLLSVSPGVAADTNLLGVMLPHMPLQHLLMRRLARPIVMTSGNVSHAPQCIDDAEARVKLGAFTDYILYHNRPIATRLDDSLVRVIAGKPRPMRRARGLAPERLRLPAGFAAAPCVLAMGAEIKNTFCFLEHGEALLSQHIGDLGSLGTFTDYQHGIAQYRQLFGYRERLIAVDAHPHYRASVYGHSLAHEVGKVEIVQHHHAHVAACLADNGVALDDPPVLGVVLDGMGHGTDGTQWGGEILLADYRSYERVAALEPIRLPGGDQVVRQPWRACYAYLRQTLGWSEVTASAAGADLADFLAAMPLRTLDGMMATGFNALPSSSCGRLFDAVAAALGICRSSVEYEGEAALRLEAMAVSSNDPGAYPFDIRIEGGMRWLASAPMWLELLSDLRRQVPARDIARRFHRGLAQALVRLVVSLVATMALERRVERIALSGGVFQNQLLFEAVERSLLSHGLQVLSHARVPCNDGGLSLGQAAICAARNLRTPCA
jgi:hydrogenase maturation protein HypF